MSFKFPCFNSKAKNSYPEFTKGLETFSWKDLSNTSEIGRGSFGVVLLASFNTSATSKAEKVVVKKLLPSSRFDEKQRFFKEARLLHSLDHKNVTKFRKVCLEPPAMMMEYVSFDFTPFCPDGQKVSNLQDFLGYLDESDAVGEFPPALYRKVVSDVAMGLKYLHETNVYHRDLKTSNILVSNIHYCDLNKEDLLEAFNLNPIVCKLTDFGEGRSLGIQTQLLANTKTTNVDRGTPSFMAPEIHTLREVGAEDLKRIDMWAYGKIRNYILILNSSTNTKG
jgi:serine/threonine protein kinase